MADARRYYYARVSSSSQNLVRQLDAFRNMGANERDIIADKISEDLERPGYQALKRIEILQAIIC